MTRTVNKNYLIGYVQRTKKKDTEHLYKGVKSFGNCANLNQTAPRYGKTKTASFTDVRSQNTISSRDTFAVYVSPVNKD